MGGVRILEMLRWGTKKKLGTIDQDLKNVTLHVDIIIVKLASWNNNAIPKDERKWNFESYVYFMQNPAKCTTNKSNSFLLSQTTIFSRYRNCTFAWRNDAFQEFPNWEKAVKLFAKSLLAHRLRDVSGTLQRANASRLIGIRLLEFRVSVKKFWQPQRQCVIRGRDETRDQADNDRSTKKRRLQYHHSFRVYVCDHQLERLVARVLLLFGMHYSVHQIV